MRRASGEPDADRLPAPALAPQRGDAEAPLPSRCHGRQRAEHGQRTAGEGLVGPRLVLRHEVRHEPVVAHAAVVGRHDVLDLVGQERARVDLGCVTTPVEEHDLAPVAERLVGEEPDIGDPEAAGDQEQVPAARVHLEPLAQRPEHVEAVAGPHPGEPGGPAPDLPEVDRDGARGGVRGVHGERTAQDEARPVARPDVDELARPGRARERRRVVLLEPLAGQDLAALEELGLDQLHGRSRTSGPGRRDPSGQRSLSASSSPSASSSVVLVVLVVLVVELRRDGRIGLGDRVGHVAEDIGRVVELDELLRRAERPPLAARRPRG